MGATNRAMPSTFAGSSVSPGTSVKRTPYWLSNRRQALGKAQRRSQIPSGDRPICSWVRALDIEQDEVEDRQLSLVGAIAEKARGLDGGMQAESLGAR